MSFNWTNYYNLAKDLAQPDDAGNYDEAKLRCAISRAYYAVFCRARNALLNPTNGSFSVPTDGTAHGYVYRQFLNSDEKIWKKIGLALGRLKLERTKADYDDLFPNIQTTTQEVITNAQQALSRLDNLP